MCACLLRAGTNEPEPRIVYFIYSLLMGLAAFLLTPYWFVRGLRHGKYFFHLRERLGLSFPALAKLPAGRAGAIWIHARSEEHTSELQSRGHLVCRLLLEKK